MLGNNIKMNLRGKGDEDVDWFKLFHDRLAVGNANTMRNLKFH
jgi:hypothetical protein